MLLYFCHSSRNQLCRKKKKPFVVAGWRNNLIFHTRRKPISHVLALALNTPFGLPLFGRCLGQASRQSGQ
jgi:hypothetical protein